MEGTLDQYEYLADSEKLAAYESALSKCVNPGDSVLDLGCGSGILGLMALRAGAGKAYFIDHGTVVETARQTIGGAGFGDRAEFLEASSYEAVLPERVDIVVCDHVGYFGFDYGILELFADARKRFLKPDGVLLPGSINLFLAPVDSDKCQAHVSQWVDGSIPADFAWLAETAANTKHPVNLEPKDVLADPIHIETLELGTDVSPFHSWAAEFTIARDGKLDGIAGWFDAMLVDGVRMTNSPLVKNSLTRPQAYLPLQESIAVKAGETINVTVMARPSDNVIGWVIELPGSGKRFSQNTFNGVTLDKAAILRSQPGRVARINNRGRARQVVLSYCDGKRTVEDVRQLVLHDHPNLFPSIDATIAFVDQVLSCDTSD